MHVPVELTEQGERYVASSTWSLAQATTSRAHVGHPGALDRGGTEPYQISHFNRLVQHALAWLDPGQSLTWRYKRSSTFECPVEVQLACQAAHTDALGAEASVRQLHTMVRVLLAAVSGNLRFLPTQCSVEVKNVVEIGPEFLRVRSGPAIGYVERSSGPALALLTMPPLAERTVLHDLPLLLSQMPVGTTFEIIASGRPPSASEVQSIQDMQRLLESGRTRIERDTFGGRETITDLSVLQHVSRLINCWCVDPRGYTVRCVASPATEVSSALLQLAGDEVFGGRRLRIEYGAGGNGVVDLSRAHHVSEAPPPLLPDLQVLQRLGLPRLLANPKVKLSEEGVIVGSAALGGTMEKVRVADRDRERHCYLVGGTGTGKSTLLRHLIFQDFRRGSGVIVLDPHGDLFHQLLECVPVDRVSDVVVLDPTKVDRVASINILECPGSHKAVQQNLVINELNAMFHRMYDMKAAGGPVFEQYMRFALLLLMGARQGTVTLADLPQVFDNAAFRTRLLKECGDHFVREFWERAARREGDHALHNLAAYITSKVTRFIDNPLIRPIVSQSRCTIDFQRILDQRQILLVNLSKGFLGELDSHFLGTVIVAKLLGAALARAERPIAQRRTVQVYIDEFQNFTSDSLGTILCEARKYGLSLTMAHQHVAQIPPVIFEAVMSNAAIKLLFRVGVADAARLESYCLPQFGKEDLAALPDFHAICSMVSANGPVRPFACETLREPHISNQQRAWLAAQVVARSARQYTRDAQEIERLLQRSAV